MDLRAESIAIRTATELADTACAAVEAELRAGRLHPATDRLLAASARARARVAVLMGYPDGEV